MERKYQPIDKIKITSCYDDDTYYLNRDGKWLRVRVKYDEDLESPREWNNLGTIRSCRGNWDISDKGYSLTKDEMIDWMDKTLDDPNVYRLPVYMYDHSGQTISLAPFGDPWDSGQCGWISCTKDEALKWGYKEETWREQAKKAFESEIEIYDAYITGTTYGYVIEEPHIISHTDKTTGYAWETEDWEEIDSLYGFYGDDPNKNGLFSELLYKDEILYEEVKE